MLFKISLGQPIEFQPGEIGSPGAVGSVPAEPGPRQARSRRHVLHRENSLPCLGRLDVQGAQASGSTVNTDPVETPGEAIMAKGSWIDTLMAGGYSDNWASFAHHSRTPLRRNRER